VPRPRLLDSIKGYNLPFPVPYIASFDVQRIRAFVCHVDRHDAAKSVKTHFGSDRWPKVVIVPGASRQKHQRFIERLARFEMREFLDDVDITPEDIFPELSWPRALRINSTDQCEQWLANAWPRLGGRFSLPDDRGNIDACAEAIKDAIDH